MSCSKTPVRKPRDSSGGFTLIEVMVALAILAVVTVLLLGKRTDIVRDAAQTRDMRTAWTLAAQKIGELELDPTVFSEEGGGSSGDFHEYGEEYQDFRYDYDVRKEEVPTNDPKDTTQKPATLFRLTLTVRTPGSEEEPIVLEGLYPVPKEVKK